MRVGIGGGGEQQLTGGQIETAFDGAMGRIRRCFVLAAGDEPVRGRLTFGLRVAGSGRVTAVLGTHTHVPTADEEILRGGTAFQCDVGMTGPHESILGRRIDRVLETTLTFNPTHFEVALGDVRLCGTIVECDPATGRATRIERLRINQAEAQRLAQVGSGQSEVGVRS